MGQAAHLLWNKGVHDAPGPVWESICLVGRHGQAGLLADDRDVTNTPLHHGHLQKDAFRGEVSFEGAPSSRTTGSLSHQWRVSPPPLSLAHGQQSHHGSGSRSAPLLPPPQVPVVQFGDEVLVGSSAIMSRVAAEAEASHLGGKKAPSR